MDRRVFLRTQARTRPEDWSNGQSLPDLETVLSVSRECKFLAIDNLTSSLLSARFTSFYYMRFNGDWETPYQKNFSTVKGTKSAFLFRDSPALVNRFLIDISLSFLNVTVFFIKYWWKILIINDIFLINSFVFPGRKTRVFLLLYYICRNFSLLLDDQML